jgi:hypothetical protein
LNEAMGLLVKKDRTAAESTSLAVAIFINLLLSLSSKLLWPLSSTARELLIRFTS